MKNPFIEGKKIYLRTIVKADLNDKYVSWFNSSEVCEFNDHHRFPMYKKKLEEYYNSVIKTQSAIVLAIVSKDGNEHIGNVALQNIDLINRSAELALVIGSTQWWGKGVGKEVCQLMIEHGFKSLQLHRIYCGTAENNVGMNKLAASLGMKPEGFSREALFKDGSYKNLVQYSILAHEYLA